LIFPKRAPKLTKLWVYGFLDAGLHAIPHRFLPVYGIDVVQCLRQRRSFIYGGPRVHLYGIHCFAMAHRKYIDSSAQPDGWMAIAFLFVSLLGVLVFGRAGDIPVMIVFVGLSLIYATEIPTRLLSWNCGPHRRTVSIDYRVLVAVLHIRDNGEPGIRRQGLDMEAPRFLPDSPHGETSRQRSFHERNPARLGVTE
jgi:hypothetical protein